MTEPNSGDTNIEEAAAQQWAAAQPITVAGLSGIAAWLNAIAPSEAHRIAAGSLIKNLSQMSNGRAFAREQRAGCDHKYHQFVLVSVVRLG